MEDELFHRLLVEEMECLLGIVDMDMVVRYKNPGCEKMFGFRTEEVIGSPVLGHMHEQDRIHYANLFQQLIEHGPGSVGHVAVKMSCRDGKSLRRWRKTAP